MIFKGVLILQDYGPVNKSQVAMNKDWDLDYYLFRKIKSRKGCKFSYKKDVMKAVKI